MGLHVVYSGKVLENIQQTYGVSRDEILRFHTTLNGRASRIDYAIDLRDAGIDLNQLWYELENGRAVTKSAHTRTQSGNGKGDTVYVGSRKTRKKMLRVYDKAKEQQDFVSDFIRAELETRGDAARNSLRHYQDNDYSAAILVSMVRGFCDFPRVESWNSCFVEQPSKIPVGDKSIGNTEKWLLNQVAHAFARVLIDNPEFYEVFKQKVELEYNFLAAITTE